MFNWQPQTNTILKIFFIGDLWRPLDKLKQIWRWLTNGCTHEYNDKCLTHFNIIRSSSKKTAAVSWLRLLWSDGQRHKFNYNVVIIQLLQIISHLQQHITTSSNGHSISFFTSSVTYSNISRLQVMDTPFRCISSMPKLARSHITAIARFISSWDKTQQSPQQWHDLAVQQAIYHVSQKTAPFYFCNNFVKPSAILIIFGTHVPR